jgi:hypothetical protein
MQREAGQQERQRLVFRCLVGAGVVLLLGAAWWAVRYGPVEVAIHGFASSPSQTEADKLMALLDQRRPARRQGARILKLLLSPEITVRGAYPAGQPANVSVARRWRIEVPQGRIVLEQSVWVAGRPTNACRESWTYQAQIRTECKIMHPVHHPTRPTVWDRLRAQLQRCLPGVFRPRPWVSDELTYQCGFVTPFDVNIVEKDQAERLELITDPQTDQTVRAGVTAAASNHRAIYETPAGRRGYRGSADVTFKTLPVAVAFELSLRLPDGRELPAGTKRQPQHFRLRAGDFGALLVDVGSFGLTEPGEYAGTLVLRPDPDHAYENPAIKSIWNGTLEFPISFFIAYVRTQAQ